MQCLQLTVQFRHGRKELDSFVDSHVEYIGNRFSFISYFKCFAVVAFPITDFAVDIYVGQEIHLDGAQSGTLAVLATAAADIETEAAGLVATYAGRRQLCENPAYVVKYTDIGGWIRSWCAANWALVYLDDLVYILNALDALVGEWGAERVIKMLAKDWLEGVVDEG